MAPYGKIKADTIVYDNNGVDAERSFASIATGSAPTADPTFTGTVTIPTPAAGDNTTTGFTLSVTPSSADNINIFISGVYQNSKDSGGTANYTVAGTTLTFATAPPTTATNGIEVVITQ